MILVRTCGSGTIHNDERLKLLKTMLEYHSNNMNDFIHKIFKLHDHKGELTVYWFESPSYQEQILLEDAWEFFNEHEICHKKVTIING